MNYGKSLFDIAREFSEESGYKFIALYELPPDQIPSGQYPGYFLDFLERNGKVVDVDDVLDKIAPAPIGIIVLFKPLGGDTVAYELSEHCSAKLQGLIRGAGLDLSLKPVVQ